MRKQRNTFSGRSGSPASLANSSTQHRAYPGAEFLNQVIDGIPFEGDFLFGSQLAASGINGCRTRISTDVQTVECGTVSAV